MSDPTKNADPKGIEHQSDHISFHVSEWRAYREALAQGDEFSPARRDAEGNLRAIKPTARRISTGLVNEWSQRPPEGCSRSEQGDVALLNGVNNMAFDPKNLIPAAQVAAFAKTSEQRSVKQVALDNIAKMKALFADPKAEGKRNFKVEGDRVAFTVRVNNTAMMLETATVKGTKVEVKEMTAPKAEFADALDYYAGRINSGEFDAQLEALDVKRTARSEKMRTTRAAKPKK